jgi:hypothetical protein
MAKKIEVVLQLRDKNFNRGIKDAIRNLNQLKRAVASTSATVGVLGGGGAGGLGGLGAGLAGVGAGIGAASTTIQSATENITTNITSMSDAAKQVFDDLGDGENMMKKVMSEDFRENVRKAKDNMSNLETQMDSNTTTTKETSGGFLKFISIAALVAGAVATLTVAFRTLTKSVQVSAEFERVEITLANLTGTAAKGARALEVITEKAQELPFAFSELASASPTLLTVSANLEEFRDNIQLAADIAANFNIPFETAVSGLQRAFSAGSGAADVFRERGVLAAAGFKAGVTVSIDETITKLKDFGKEIEGAASKLNLSLGGAASQAGDAFTLFNKELGDAIKPELTAFLLTITNLFRQNKADIDALAKSIGGKVIDGFIAVGRAVAILIDLFTIIFAPIKALNNALNVMGTNLPIVATAIYIVVKAQKAMAAASLAAANAFIFLQGVTGVGLLKVAAGITAAVATTAVLTKAFNEAGESITTSGLDGEPDSALGKFNALLVDITDEAGNLRTEADAIAPALEPLNEIIVDIASNTNTATTEVKTFADRLREVKDAIDLGTGGLEQYNLLLEILKQFLADGKIGFEEYTQLVRDLDEAFMQNEGLNSFIDTLGTAQVALSEDLATAFLEGEKAGDAFKSFFKKMITQIIADIIRLQVMQPIIQALMGAFGMPGTFTAGGSFKLTGKARGGPVMPGGTYLVGEEGPELLQMGGSGGNIVPNGSIGGGQVTYNINAVDAPSFQQLVASDPQFIYAVTQAGARSVPGAR